MKRTFASLSSLIMTLSFATAAWSYNDITWTPRSDDGSLSFAKALAELALAGKQDVVLSQPLTAGDLLAATCTLNVKAPLIGDERTADANNHALCQVSTVTGSAEIRWNIPNEILRAWGTRTFPRGVSMNGVTAQELFEALARAYRPEMPYLSYKNVRLSSATFVYETIEYTIFSEPKTNAENNNGFSLMSCWQEYYYPKGGQRNDVPDNVFCDFIYCLRDDPAGGPNKCYDEVNSPIVIGNPTNPDQN